MPRFKWISPSRGRKISNYINVMCTRYPKIAKAVVKHGIGDLDSWFGGRGALTPRTPCGCLVGTTALVVMQQYPKCKNALPAIRKVSNTHDGAEVLFNFIRVQEGKKPVSDWEVRGLPRKERRLYECISAAGYAAADEAHVEYQRLLDGDGELRGDREREVIDHIEMQIRKKLGIKNAS